MNINSLSGIDFDIVFEAFSKAFADYEVQLNKNQLQTMLKRRGFNLDLSFAAFDGGDIVSFTYNGIGDFEGIMTAYDTGTGTILNYRGRGMATKIFEYSIPYLKKAGIKQYLLEVLQHNTKAVSVYRNLGFEVSREFYYFIQNNDEIRNEVKMLDILYEIKSINIEEYGKITDFWDFYPSWQNGMESIRRSSSDFVSVGLFAGMKLVGYYVFEPASGDITQIAVERQYRRRGFGSLLLQRVLELNKYNSIKVINTDVNCDSIKNFLESKNIIVRGKQFEMIKSIPN